LEEKQSKEKYGTRSLEGKKRGAQVRQPSAEKEKIRRMPAEKGKKGRKRVPRGEEPKAAMGRKGGKVS